MGTLRLLLALSVVVGHIHLYWDGEPTVRYEYFRILVNGGSAVFCFFMISGFYMSLILNEKYANLPQGTRRFYLNRALKIYPGYFLGLVLTLIVNFLVGRPNVFFGDYLHPLWEWIGAVVSQIILFGIEILPMVDGDNFDKMIVNPPAWSLGVELYFYCLAPLIVRLSTRSLLWLTPLAFLSRAAVYWWAAGNLARYYFFPGNIVFFLMGCLSYRLYVQIRSHPQVRKAAVAAAVILACYTGFLPQWGEAGHVQLWGLFLCMPLAIPFLFAATKSSRLDQWLGNLSYPIYVIHTAVLRFTAHVGDAFAWPERGVIAIAATLALAYLIHRYFETPIERTRAQVAAGSPPASLSI